MLRPAKAVAAILVGRSGRSTVGKKGPQRLAAPSKAGLRPFLVLLAGSMRELLKPDGPIGQEVP